MKKKIYLSLLLIMPLMVCALKSEAQYHITSVTRIDTVPEPYCDTVDFYVTTNVICTGCSTSYVKTIFGDGFSVSSSDWTSPVSAHNRHCYSSPGIYSVKHILYTDSCSMIPGAGSCPTLTDSAFSIVDNTNSCYILPIRIFEDILGTGIYDNSIDPLFLFPVKIEVSLNGNPIDTFSCTSGLYCNAIGVPGDIYSFRIISIPYNAIITSPTGGIINDTINSVPNSNPIRYFGLKCSGTGSFDLSVNPVIPVTGVHDQWGDVYVTNWSCDTANATVVLNFSPKYSYYVGSASPIPSAISSSSISWVLPSLGATVSPVHLHYQVVDPAGDVVVGDTVQEHVTVTPLTGDTDPSNNIAIVIDTVRGGVDPNEMSVSPSGNITSGTQLQYTIGFENTGNDTAYNISVYDTLSDNVDIKSLNLIMASAVMNIATLNVGGHNIVKFDFPNINLLDSSHHGLCNGAVIFTINTKAGLADGTIIFNHAGIFFDYNPVVMTNTVEDIIGFPAGVAAVSTASKVSVYPNPANDEVIIKADNGLYSTATFTNVIGQQVMVQSFTNPQTSVDVSRLPAGMYYITLRGASGIKVVKFEKL